MASPKSAQTKQTERILVQIASYNTNLQGVLGLPQDLVDWLSPTLQVSSFLSRTQAPDIVAVGFQELLPLPQGLSGFSKRVIESRDALILSQIEANAPNQEKYSLVGKVVNVGVAMLVYARDDGIARRIHDVQTQWTGFGPGYMGNKGAVGVRFRVSDSDSDSDTAGEIFTFVCAHLTAFEEKLSRRISDYHHIVGCLLFPPLPGSQSSTPTTIFSTSHLFFFGDLNFRLALPPTHLFDIAARRSEFAQAIASETTREDLKEFDQLLCERRKGTIFHGLREGDFWKFKCSYKYVVGEVDRYSAKRTPSWTDRIMYTTYLDSLDKLEESNITNILYTSIPSYTTSDHKPIVSLLLLPSSKPSRTIPLLQLPENYQPAIDPRANMKRYAGRSLDRMVGIVWWLLTFVGAGYASVGLFNVFLAIGTWNWWRKSWPSLY